LAAAVGLAPQSFCLSLGLPPFNNLITTFPISATKGSLLGRVLWLWHWVMKHASMTKKDLDDESMVAKHLLFDLRDVLLLSPFQTHKT
jgi:hypothetical protein